MCLYYPIDTLFTTAKDEITHFVAGQASELSRNCYHLSGVGFSTLCTTMTDWTILFSFRQRAINDEGSVCTFFMKNNEENVL